MPTVTVYETRTGRIVRVVTGPANIIDQQAQTGEGYAAGTANTLTQYVNTAKRRVENRPKISATVSKSTIVADGADIASISGLPQPCTVTLEGQIYRVEDGTLSLTTDIPGSFLLTVQAWPYLDAEFTVEASPCA